MRKQPTFGDATTGFPAKSRLRNEAEIPYWWRVTTQIWVVLLIGRAAWEFDSANQKHYPDLGSDASSVWISALVSPTSFGGETSGGVAKCRLFSQASN